jgi:hypothetical protein
MFAGTVFWWRTIPNLLTIIAPPSGAASPLRRVRRRRFPPRAQRGTAGGGRVDRRHAGELGGYRLAGLAFVGRS